MEQILLGMILENVELDESDDSKTVLISWKPGKLTAESILKMVRER